MSLSSLQFPTKLEPLFEPHRYKILYGGRGSTKSWSVARAFLRIGAAQKERFLCTREIQRTINESVHQLLKDQIGVMGLESFYTVTDNSIKGLNGTEFLFAGLRQQDVAKLKSFEGVTKVWVEEGQAVTRRSWEVLIPTIRTEGSEIWVTFNPELDTDETYQRFVAYPPEDSVVIKMNYTENPWFPEVLEKERLALKARDPEAYDNVWEGNCRAAVEGAIYAKEIVKLIEEHRIRPMPYDPMFKVHAIWDLGWNDKMTIVMAQKAASSMMVIDYIEDSHRTYASYVEELDAKEYRWGKDWLPHDGKHKDPKTGKSHIDVLRALGRDVDWNGVPDIGVEAGIKLARQMLPTMYFDEDKTMQLVHCLKRYRRMINQNTNEPGAPLHDEFSHGADAIRYLAVIADKLTNDIEPIPMPRIRTEWGF